MTNLDKVCRALVFIGAINWGLVGLFQLDIVATIFGGQTAVLSRIIYAAVGAAGVQRLISYRKTKSVEEDKHLRRVA